MQITSNFEQVKQVIGVSVEMAQRIDKLITDKVNYSQIVAATSEQFANMFANAMRNDKSIAAKFKGIDGKEEEAVGRG